MGLANMRKKKTLLQRVEAPRMQGRLRSMVGEEEEEEEEEGGDRDCCSTAAAADEGIESAGVGGVCRQPLEGTVREAARHEVDVVVEDGVELIDVTVGEVDAGENGTQVEAEKDGTESDGMQAGAGICV